MIGWLASVSGLALLFAEMPRILEQLGSFQLWWTALGFTMVAIIVVLAIGGRLLPFGLLRVLWITVPALTLGLQLATFAAFTGDDPNTLMPWVWRFETLTPAYAVLVLPPRAALAYPILSALTPLVSALVFLDEVPAEIAAWTPVHMGNVVFAVINLGARARLTSLAQAEDRARAEEARSAVLEARAEREARLARLVHDEALSVFAAAMLFPRRTPPEVRHSARRALTTLRHPAARSRSSLVNAVELGRELAEVADGIAPGIDLSTEATGEGAPSAVAETLRLALSEAVRNVVRHAGDGRASVHIRIDADGVRVIIEDEGPGFDHGAVPADRLGVRGSILGRMRALPGGDARIRSSPSGTRVELGWQR